jgi:hypothetical protein
MRGQSVTFGGSALAYLRTKNSFSPTCIFDGWVLNAKLPASKFTKKGGKSEKLALGQSAQDL